MTVPISKAVKPPKIERTSILDFLKGYESTFSADRLANDALRIAANVIAQQNGTIEPRPSLCLYGTQPPGTLLGTVYPYVDTVTTGVPVNMNICVCVVSGTANVYVSKDGGAWTKATGKTYDTAAPCWFEQINNDVLVMNAVDNLSYFEIGTTTIVPFTSLATPATPSLATSGSLTSGSTTYNYFYRISAVNLGETAGSVDSTTLVNTQRTGWNQQGRTGDGVTLTITRVTGAQYYNIYVGDQTGLEYYLDTVQDAGTGTTQVYLDNNTVVVNTNRIAPNSDSTAGPRVKRATNVLGQVFMYDDADNPYRVWFGGFGSTALDFSAFDGGGWVEIDHGGRDFPAKIHGFRDGHGNPVATLLMSGQSGLGKIVHLAMTSTTVNNTILTYVQLEEGNGQDGTTSPDAVIYAQDRLWYPSRNGFKSTGTNADMQNILATNDFGQGIIPDILSLNVLTMQAACGLETLGRLYFAVPVASTKNNQIWVCDLNRGQMWTNPWYVNVDWMWLYDDSAGVTHHMALSDGQICEFSYKQMTTDITTPFSTDIASGNIKFAPDGVEWAQVIDVTFVFEQPQGQINVAVTGDSLNGGVSQLGDGMFTPTVTPTGWDDPAGYWSNPSFYWAAVPTIPIISSSSREEITVPIDEQMDYVGYEVTSNTPGVDYQLADVVVRWVDIGALLNQNTG